MNNNYFETLDENFTQALKFYETQYSQSELMQLLQSGNITEKQIAALKLEGIFSKQEAQVLVSNLTGQDGKIREAVSLRIKEFMNNEKYLQYFQTPQNYNIFLDAITDINGNICRNTICAISNLHNKEFCKQFCPALVKLTKNLLDIVEKFDFQEGKYKINKEIFKLYWCLETIYIFWNKIKFSDLKEIILRSKNIQEYTIREKTAKILTQPINDIDIDIAREELKNDPNYFVRRFFQKK